MLAEMEAALAADDPRLVSTLSADLGAPRAGRIVMAGVSILLGLAVMLSGLVAHLIWLGIAGFLISLFGAYLTIGFFAGKSAGGAKSENSKSGNGGKGGKGFGSRVQNRWDRREP
jgi:uncharacterized membrane protein HdeD (DUF308 family)